MVSVMNSILNGTFSVAELLHHTAEKRKSMKTHYENPFRDIRQARGSILEGNRSAAFFVSAMVASFCFVVFMVVRVGITNFEFADKF